MFKKIALFIFILFLISFASLSLYWQNTTGLELYSDTNVANVYRISQDLGGKWDSFSSLREASVRENSVINGSNTLISGLNQQDSIILPSNRGFKVAAKHFKVSGKWGSMNARLVLKGVNGKIRVFINGIDEVNFLGEYESSGGNCSIDIAPAMPDYSLDNTIYLELSPGSIQQKKLLGWLWPEQGRITGQIYLEAVQETTIDVSTVKYLTAEQQVVVNVNLTHHQNLEFGPWTISGVIKDKDINVAECLLPLNSNREYNQRVNLIFKLPQAKLWSTENPFLYELDLSLTNSRGDTDRIQIPIGVNKNSSKADNWLLNDKKFDARAQILTQDQENILRNKRQIESYLKEAKTKGYNVVYFMGFFPDESWLFAADRLGIGVWLEIPVSLVPEQNIPQNAQFEDLFAIAERHPSVLAWTAAKGLQPSAEKSEYLKNIGKRLSYLPVYNLDLFPGEQTGDINGQILLKTDGFSGKWGQAEYLQDSSPDNKEENDKWSGQKIVAVIWLIWISILSIQNWRSPSWKYSELFNTNPKRGVRRAFLWRCLSMFSRVASFAGLMTSLIFLLPVKGLPWLPYDLSYIWLVQEQSPLLIWLFLSAFIMLIRFFQVGLTTSFFPQSPGTAALSCWLEKRNNWGLLIGIAWTMLSYHYYLWYIPLAGYFLLSFLLLPLRIRDVWRAGGRYSCFMLLPATVTIALVLLIMWHYPDLFYGYRLMQNLI